MYTIGIFTNPKEIALCKKLKDNKYEDEIMNIFRYIVKNAKKYQAKNLFPYNIMLIGFMGSGKTTICNLLGNIGNKIFNCSKYGIFVYILSLFTGSPSNAKYIQFSSYSTSNDVVLEFSAIGGENSNILCGKKYVSCGDSFTEGDFTGLSSEEKENCKEDITKHN